MSHTHTLETTALQAAAAQQVSELLPEQLLPPSLGGIVLNGATIRTTSVSQVVRCSTDHRVARSSSYINYARNFDTPTRLK